MKHFKTKFFLLLFVVAASPFPCKSESINDLPNLLWPLEIRNGISGTFGEYRGTHLHMGVDLKTHGRTGLEVFAADDGSIFRIKYTWRGFGKAVYIRHRSGLISVYGHMERFENKILKLEDFIEAKKRRLGLRYPGNFFPKRPIPVKRGQVIGYSGETGAGFPHLHFEVRINDTVAVNPFLYGLDMEPESEPPVFDSLTFIPAHPTCRINGSIGETTYKLRNSGSVYVTDKPLSITGPFQIAVDVFDRVLAENRCGVERLQLFVDRELVRDLKFSKIPYDRYKWGGLVYDLEKSHMSPTVFRYLLRERNGPFPVLESVSQTPAIAPGKHTLEVRAKDAAGSTSVARQSFTTDPFPKITFFQVEKLPDGTAKIRIGCGKDPEGQSEGQGARRFHLEFADKACRKFIPLRLPFHREKDEFVTTISFYPKIIRAFVEEGGRASPWVVRILDPENIPVPRQPEASLRLDLTGKTIFARLKTNFTPREQPALHISFDREHQETIQLQYTSLREFQAFIQAPKRSVSVEAEYKTILLPRGRAGSNTLELHRLSVGKRADIAAGDYRLALPGGALFEDAILSVTTVESSVKGPLTVGGPVLDISPRNIPFRKVCSLSFTPASVAIHPEKLGLYLWDNIGDRWVFQYSSWDKASKIISARIRSIASSSVEHSLFFPATTTTFSGP